MGAENRVKVQTECGACSGTGLYSGFAEPKGVAVVCLQCNGTGCHEISYIPFICRKPKANIKTVQLSRGSFILSCGPAGRRITYAEFIAGKIPESK